MSPCRNPDSRWPPVKIKRRAKEVDDTRLIPFVDTDAAARYLALNPTRSNATDSAGSSFTRKKGSDTRSLEKIG